MTPNFYLMPLVGLLTGIFSGLFGIGGGVIIVPILAMLFGYPQITAVGISLVALLLPVGFFGVREYYLAEKINNADIKTGLLIAVGLFFGAFIGAKIAIGLPAHLLKKGFAVFLVFIAAKLWFTS